MRTEPVLSTTTITAAITAILTLLVAFGVPISEDQKIAILGVIAVIAPLIVLITRKWVTPNTRVVEHTQGGDVVAGAANELTTGEIIRPVGSLNRTPTHRAMG